MRLLTLAIAYLLFCDGILCRHIVYEDEGAASPSQATQVKRHPHNKESPMKHGKSKIQTSTPINNATGHSHKHADPLDVLNIIFSVLFPPYSTTTTGNVTFKSATPSKASHRTTTHKTTELKSASHQHTIHSFASTTHTKNFISTANHAMHPQMTSISKVAPAEHHPTPSQKAKTHYWKSTSQTKKSKHNKDNDDNDDDDNGDYDGGKNIHRSAIPSATILNALPSLTATAPDPKLSHVESEMVEAARTNKIIGIVVGLGCVAIGSAGLFGYILSRRRDRAQKTALSEGSVQTRWRPHSFLAVVSTAVNRIQSTCSRDNSFKNNANTNSQGMRTSPLANAPDYTV